MTSPNVSHVLKDIEVKSGIDERLKSLDDTLDISEAPPIHQKRLVTIFNHFVISMVDLLNNFLNSCTDRLFSFEQKLCKVEAELRLLETKLNSIPELEDKKDVNVVLPPPQELNSMDQSTGPEEFSTQPDTVDSNVAHEESTPTTPVNPEVAKYMRMVQVGVPKEAVKIKMKLEGLDPDLLN